jgi:hypothetical protein
VTALELLQRALRSESRRVLLPLVAYKAFLLALVPASLLLLPGLFNADNYRDNFHWPAEARPTVATAFAAWDSQHFLYLSLEGYQRRPPREAPFNAFYPLWPALIRLCSGSTPQSHLIAALVLSNLLSLAALFLFHQLVLTRHGPAAAHAALLLLLSFPSAFYLSLPYSESLFLLLAVLLFLFLDAGHARGVALAAFLAALTRAPGLFLALPIAAHLIWTRERRPSRLLLCCAPMLGFLCYLAVMQVATGDALTGFKVYGYYAVDRVRDWESLLRALSPPSGLAIHGFGDSALDRALFVLLLAALPLIARLGPAYLVYALAVGVMPAPANSFTSFNRYLLVVFPLFVALGVFFESERRRAWGAALGAVFFGLQIMLLVRHVNFLWAG